MKIRRQIVDKGSKEMKLKLIEKGLEIGVNEFTLKGPRRYEVLDFLVASGVNFSYKGGKVKIQ